MAKQFNVYSFYNPKKKLNKWSEFNIPAVDGTSIQVPDNIKYSTYFGISKNQNETQTIVVMSSVLYDVLNDIIIDASITKFKTSERELAKQHLDKISNKKLSKKTAL